MTIYLNRKNNWTIRWDGYDTRRIYHWVAFGNSYEEIWDITVLKDINHLEYEEEYRLKKLGKEISQYFNEDGYIDDEVFENEVFSVRLSEEDYKEMLLKSKGNAYYSEFTED